MNDLVLSALPGAIFAAVLLFLGAWENERRTRRTEARKDAAAERAALEEQADRFVAAVLALKLEGNAHDVLWGGWRAKAAVLGTALIEGAFAYLEPSGGGAKALVAGRAVNTVIDKWNEEGVKSAQALAGPLGRLSTAATPLLRRREPGLADSVRAVMDSITESYTDDDQITRALSSFHDTLASALEPPAPTRRRWFRRGGTSE
ncbi:hypothetical protein ACFV6U_28370 [Streptomyces sp. NPDC059810]|uniref:hypothetical protein n=1 Tax=Streptomyces sp. NPDC059810 TaxID=3346956 RepID=UPI0036543B31